MSQLTDALERIFRWMEQHELERNFEPGLNLSKIEAITKYLPFLLPEEVCDLYRWRNGGSFAKRMSYYNFLTMFFLSLEDAREEYRNMRDSNKRPLQNKNSC